VVLLKHGGFFTRHEINEVSCIPKARAGSIADMGKTIGFYAFGGARGVSRTRRSAAHGRQFVPGDRIVIFYKAEQAMQTLGVDDNIARIVAWK
jgi:hypothetical protein